MIRVDSIQPTKNAKIVKVEFTQVLTPLEAARGFSSGKKYWETADADNNTFKVGQTFPANIEMVEHAEPQYEGHQPFEKNGKYYTSKLV